MNDSPLSVIIQAAGASQRLGQAKQLVLKQGKPLICWSVEKAASLEPLEIIVVTGADSERVEQAIENTGARCVHNPHWQNGMGTSIARGSSAIKPESTGVMILLCDQWRITPKNLQALTTLWHTDRQQIVCAETAGRHGPPAIFPLSCYEQLRALQGECGARSVLAANPGLIRILPMKSAGTDLDTPSQLEDFNAG